MRRELLTRNLAGLLRTELLGLVGRRRRRRRRLRICGLPIRIRGPHHGLVCKLVHPPRQRDRVLLPARMVLMYRAKRLLAI